MILLFICTTEMTIHSRRQDIFLNWQWINNQHNSTIHDNINTRSIQCIRLRFTQRELFCKTECKPGILEHRLLRWFLYVGVTDVVPLSVTNCKIVLSSTQVIITRFRTVWVFQQSTFHLITINASTSRALLCPCGTRDLVCWHLYLSKVVIGLHATTMFHNDIYSA